MKKRQSNQHMTFTSFLIEANTDYEDTKSFLQSMNPNHKPELADGEMTVFDFIRSLDTYQDLKKNAKNKGPAMELVAQFRDTYGGNAVVDQSMKDDIADAFDDVARDANPHGANMYDQGREDAANRRDQDDQQTFNDETSPTVKRKRMNRGATMQTARFGKAKDEMKDIADSGGEPAPRAVRTPMTGGGSKASRALDQFKSFADEHDRIPSRSEFIKVLLAEPFNMSKSGAQTYYYNVKKKYATMNESFSHIARRELLLDRHAWN